jgi:hypothetical protein
VIEGRRVFPSFSEGEIKISHCRPLYLQLDVVPGRMKAISPVEFDGLRITSMTDAVSAAMA